MTNTAPEVESDLKTKTVELGEYGAQLPLGFRMEDGSYAKDIASRPWRMKEERELGALRDESQDPNIAQYVSLVLATMCTKLGHHDFDNMKPEARRVVIGQMYMGDVFYVYVWLRSQVMGEKLDLDITCPRCRHNFSFGAKLGTIEVEVADNLEAATWEYDLKTPIQIRGKEVSRLRMGPCRWNLLEEMRDGAGSSSTVLAKSVVLRGSIQAFPEHKSADGKPMIVALTDDELDEMVKVDIETLTRQIDRKSIGPSMAIELKCEKCKRKLNQPIDWTYDAFFADSSR